LVVAEALKPYTKKILKMKALNPFILGPLLNDETDARDYKNGAGGDPHRHSFFEQDQQKMKSKQGAATGKHGRFSCPGVADGLKGKDASQSKGQNP
jgi:hypothetical protein